MGPLQRAKAAEQFYDGQTQHYRQQIAQIESKLAVFKAKNYDQLPGLTDLNMNIMQTTQRDLDNVTQQIEAMRQNRVFLQQQLDAAKNAGQDSGLLAQLQAEYNKKLATYDPNYPDMIALRQQIDELQGGRRGGQQPLAAGAASRASEQALAQAKLRYSESFPDVQRLERQIKILKTRIAHGEKYAGNASGQPGRWSSSRRSSTPMRRRPGALERQSAQLQAAAMQLDGRIEATPRGGAASTTRWRSTCSSRRPSTTSCSSTRWTPSSRARRSPAAAATRSASCSHPGVPLEPAKPKRIAIGAVGLMLAILLGLTVVVIAESVDQSVRGSRDVRSVLALAPLAVIPEIADRRPRAAAGGRWQC